MEGPSSGNFMSYGDHNSNSLSPMVMMMPFMTSSSTSSSHHHQQHHPNADHQSNTLFLPLPSNTTSHNHNSNNNQNHNHNQNHNFSLILENHHQHNNNNSKMDPPGYFMENNNNNNNNSNSSIRAKIMAHPYYSRLLAAYVNCQKVGAPPEVVARLEVSGMEAMGRARSSTTTEGGATGSVGEDPALDQFMEAYCEMLTKYEQELSKPFKEAMIFLSRIECQFKALSVSASSDSAGHDAVERNGSSDDDVEASDNYIDPQAEDRELKGQLLRKYSGYLGSLKQEFLKKRKKGKLPKEARQQLLEWWSRHYKWPYPSESQKIALAESTGLDQKQINNWFINQRKRHWKPSEEMQFVVMDPGHQHYYMDNVPYPMDCTATLH